MMTFDALRPLRRLSALLGVALLLGLAPGGALAQSCDGDCPTYDQGPDVPDDPVGLTKRSTDKISNMIAEANVTCGSAILRKYRIDCLRIYYKQIAESLPNNGEYLPIKRALENASLELGKIVKANIDRPAGKIQPRYRNKPAAPKMPSLRAVKPEAEAAALKAAEKVVAETAMIILRSGEDPSRRTAHYQEIAAAVDSNMLILRSA